jgi:hypothetical protein
MSDIQFTTFDPERNRGKDPLAWIAEQLHKPGAIERALAAAALLAPAYGVPLRILSAVFGSARPDRDTDLEALLTKLTEEDLRRLASILAPGDRNG